MSDIYVSYANEDREKIQPLIDTLEKTTWSIFSDRAFPPGKKWLDKSESEIQKARCVIVFWTKVSVESHRVLEEADVGKQKKILIPILLDPVELPFNFQDLQSINLMNWSGDASSLLFDKLYTAISSMLDSKSEKQSTERKTKLLPDIDWVKIPAGSFIYGEKEEEQEITLESFEIARYPITNAQYDCFIHDGGYEEERWWVGLEKQRPEEPNWRQSNRPRETVSWYEAIAFCRWLSVQTGDEIRLPTEQQWEKAARSSDGREYPWGDGFWASYANTSASSSNSLENLKQTTAVGTYPQGASSYGVEDMSGNIWEWCLNNYDKPDDIDIDSSGDSRVLRGGSWDSVPELVRAPFRSGFSPGYRNLIFGFRVVRVPPIR